MEYTSVASHGFRQATAKLAQDYDEALGRIEKLTQAATLGAMLAELNTPAGVRYSANAVEVRFPKQHGDLDYEACALLIRAALRDAGGK